ncbi:ABC transporter ATP-binding protein [Paraglaciecola sp. 2405UD69-4]|uniref:ABC transporter ATP-binding protein n=1 Tax=Paraglaciecola sp. 2405UD69-4 TaxID=3391836 RepID=UPI0039C9C9B7
MIQINNLSIHYGDMPVIENLNLTLANDEILMLVGPTGCGKSTILKALAGLTPITKGEIVHQNWTANAKEHIAPEQRNVGMVFQDFALFPHLTVEQNIAFRLKDNRQSERWIEALGLQRFRHVKPNNLSGGQKQRVALARTLAHQPAFILLDEPLSNLDAALKDDLRWEIRSALKAAGIPAIWVTHDQEEALSVGDRIGVLQAGKLEQLDKPEVCYNQPVNKFVARFLGETNFISAQMLTENTCVVSALGVEQTVEQANEQLRPTASVYLLLRPEDLSMQVNELLEGGREGHGTIFSMRYEGSSRLYQIQIAGEPQSNNLVKIRTLHDINLTVGQSVNLQITSSRAKTIFSKE